MKTTKYLFILTLALAATFVNAQDYTFQVMINKGNNEVKTAEAWQPIKTGASLKPGDELKLVDNAYLGLRHVSGKMVEVKKAGSHKVADLAANISGGSTVLNKYTDFILSSNSAEAKKNRLSATGAVHRGTRDAIDLQLPDNQFSGIYGNKVIISWETKTQGPYIIELQNMFEDVLAKYETNENSYIIDLTDSKLNQKDLNAIMVKVISKADTKQTSAVKMIKRLSEDEENKIEDALKEITPATTEETAINKYFLAGFYEQNNLIVDAITAYQEAIALAPDVISFRESYEDFLIRKGIKQSK